MLSDEDSFLMTTYDQHDYNDELDIDYSDGVGYSAFCFVLS